MHRPRFSVVNLQVRENTLQVRKYAFTQVSTAWLLGNGASACSPDHLAAILRAVQS